MRTRLGLDLGVSLNWTTVSTIFQNKGHKHSTGWLSSFAMRICSVLKGWGTLELRWCELGSPLDHWNSVFGKGLKTFAEEYNNMLCEAYLCCSTIEYKWFCEVSLEAIRDFLKLCIVLLYDICFFILRRVRIIKVLGHTCVLLRYFGSWKPTKETKSLQQLAIKNNISWFGSPPF